MKLLTALLLAGLYASSARAQSAPYAGKHPVTPLELDQLPLAIKVEFARPDGWPLGHTSYWARAIWPRNVVGSGAGSWYRSDTDQLVMSVYNDRVFPRPYSCRTIDAFRGVFECKDVLGYVKRLQCPAQLVGATEPSEWQSTTPDADGRGWHLWTWENGADQRWKAWAEILVVPLATASTGDDGQRVTCNYRLAVSDAWLMWR